MDCYGWHKFMAHFTTMCCSSPLNPQVLFYDGHVRNFDDGALYIINRNKIQSFIVKAGDYVHGQSNDNLPNTNINNFYGNARMNWMRHHGTLKFTPTHKNPVLIATWEAFKVSLKNHL